jgi:hypothetical protein
MRLKGHDSSRGRQQMIVLVASSILVSTMLAWFWARKRGWFGYVNSTVAVWAGLSVLPPVDFANFLAGAILLTPLVLVPMLVLVGFVAKGSPVSKIVAASAAGSLVARPMCFLSTLYASCYVFGDCP